MGQATNYTEVFSSWKERAVAALEDSIEHWERIIAGADDAPFCGECACCVTFMAYDHCGDCPIKLRTGKNECKNTPYNHAFDEWSLRMRTTGKKETVYAKEELEFLRETLRMVKTGVVKP